MRLRTCISLFLLAVGLHLGAPLTQAQDLGGELSAIGEQYADGYVAPLTNAFGADLNAGLFRTANVGDGLIPGLPFNVYLGVSASGAFIPDSQKEFAFEGETITQNGQEVDVYVVTPDNDNQVPTIFGDTDPEGDLVFEEQMTGQTRTEPLPPGLIDFPVAPLAVPQLGIGSVAGTDVQLRYLPPTSISNYGNVGLTGVAVRHDLDQYLPGLTPLSLAAQAAWNEVSVESDDSEVLNASGWAFNVHASKSLPVVPVTFYGGLQYEKLSVDYNYTFQSPFNGETEIDLSQDAANNVRALAGVSLTLAILRINVDYALSQNNTVTAGVGLRL